MIGIGLSEEDKNSFDCVGTFYDAKDPETFTNVLKVIISQVLNSTTVQVNLLDEWDNPTETNVPITFYDSHSPEFCNIIFYIRLIQKETQTL